MQPMIEIHYLNGRRRRIPEAEFVADGESVTTVIDVGLDDLSGGLVLYYRHYAPTRPDMGAVGAQPDPRGMPAVLWNDSFAVIVAPDEMPQVEQVYYEGALVLFRFDREGELVNMHKVDKAQMLYLPDQGTANVRLRIAEAFAAMRSAYADRSPGELAGDALEASVCADLGVSVAVARECIDFQSAYALGDAAYAERNGLPYLSDDGELVEPGGATEAAGEGVGGDISGHGGAGDVDAIGFDFSS